MTAPEKTLHRPSAFNHASPIGNKRALCSFAGKPIRYTFDIMEANQ